MARAHSRPLCTCLAWMGTSRVAGTGGTVHHGWIRVLTVHLGATYLVTSIWVLVTIRAISVFIYRAIDADLSDYLYQASAYAAAHFR